MDAYIFGADLWCHVDGKEIRRTLKKAGEAPEDPDDERSYDSDDFPKGPYADGGGESDTPQHCAAGEDCMHPDATVLSDGRKIGVWLENELTSEGVAYVLEVIKEGGEVAQLWYDWYKNWYDLPDPEEEEEEEDED